MSEKQTKQAIVPTVGDLIALMRKFLLISEGVSICQVGGSGFYQQIVSLRCSINLFEKVNPDDLQKRNLLIKGAE